jgi:hypothetical protein
VNDEQAHLPRLSPQDERLLDTLVESGFDLKKAGALDAEAQRRAEAIMSLLALIDDYPVDDADPTLVDATLAAIDRHERERAGRLTLAAEAEEGGGRARRLRLPDFVSIAAVLLIGAAIAVPVMNELRERSIDTRCLNNLRWMGYAFSNYANANRGELPIAHAGFSHWAKAFENAVINLGPLIDGGYCEHGHLNCPGHEGHSGPSYSYQWPAAGVRPRWSVGESKVILGDRNPLIDALRAGGPIVPGASSSNHAGRGQNVLTTDGGARWLEQSTVGQGDKGDNIWMPRAGLHDGAATDAEDVFLAH